MVEEITVEFFTISQDDGSTIYLSESPLIGIIEADSQFISTQFGFDVLNLIESNYSSLNSHPTTVKKLYSSERSLHYPVDNLPSALELANGRFNFLIDETVYLFDSLSNNFDGTHNILLKNEVTSEMYTIEQHDLHEKIQNSSAEALIPITFSSNTTLD